MGHGALFAISLAASWSCGNNPAVQYGGYKGGTEQSPKSKCEIENCETGHTDCGGSWPTPGQSCANHADESYSAGSQGWYRFMLKACRLNYAQGCASLGQWAASYEHGASAPWHYAGGDATFWPSERPPHATLLEIRELITTKCGSMAESPEFGGETCLAAATLHNIVEPRSERTKVIELVATACKRARFIPACEYMGRELFLNGDVEGLQQTHAQHEPDSKAAAERHTFSQALEAAAGSAPPRGSAAPPAPPAPTEPASPAPSVKQILAYWNSVSGRFAFAVADSADEVASKLEYARTQCRAGSKTEKEKEQCQPAEPCSKTGFFAAAVGKGTPKGYEVGFACGAPTKNAAEEAAIQQCSAVASDCAVDIDASWELTD